MSEFLDSPRFLVTPPTPMASSLDLPHDAGRTTTYHIYNTCSQRNLIVYTTPDHMLASLCPGADIGTKLFALPCLLPRSRRRVGKRDAVTLDDPRTDLRMPAYFLHTPMLYGRDPPQTLRVGGRQGKVVCLVEGSFLWRRWKLSFVVPEEERKGVWARMRWGRSTSSLKEKKEDSTVQPYRIDSGFNEGDSTLRDSVKNHTSLNAPGVIDPRGVLSSRYPLRNFTLPGESGREYVRQQSRLRKSASCSDIKPDAPDIPELPAHLTPSVPRLELSWNGWLTREYGFKYGDIEFRWKGTGTVSDERKYWGVWSRYNHLKLVAYLPLGDGEDKEEGVNGGRDEARGDEDKDEAVTMAEERPDTPELGNRAVVLAKYISLLASRKAGRLTVFERGLEKCFSNEAERERLRHIVVATATCMIRGEKEKRKTIRDIILTALTEGVVT